MIIRIKKVLILCFMLMLPALGYTNKAIFDIQIEPGSRTFPSTVGRYDPPPEHFFIIKNQSAADMDGMIYLLPGHLIKNDAKSTCGSKLNKNSTCRLVVIFRPNDVGVFNGELRVCGAHGNWCSLYQKALQVTVKNEEIVSKNCAQIESRPFSNLTCRGSKVFSDNFNDFLKQVLNEQPTHHEFNYFQHKPSPDETTTPCLEAQQPGALLDPNIKGGGVPLCELMGYATSNASPNEQPSDTALSKQFPPYLDRLLGTSYPITQNTVPLDQLDELLLEFDTPLMDASVQDVGYTGHVDFVSTYYQQQLSKDYQLCGTAEICPSIFYLPYKYRRDPAALAIWPPQTIDRYWGMSGGGGSGAGYQIQAFKSGSTTHYTLFSGGGGGGGGNTTPENLALGEVISLINTGSGGGGGEQFSDCYIRNGDHLNGLGLGAGIGSGLSTPELTNVAFKPPPPVDYSFYPPNSHPEWSNQRVLTQYADNLAYLFNILIPKLYDQGYTIAVTGGGGGGTGLEFLNPKGEELTPHPVSVGYGFNFCYAFNKHGKYAASDCVSAPTTVVGKLTLDQIIYQNIGGFFNQCMELAILPAHCNGYTDYTCTCTFQHICVIENLTNTLVLNGFSSNDIPSWLITPHCTNSESALLSRAKQMDKAQNNQYSKALKGFYQAKNDNMCVPPWDA